MIFLVDVDHDWRVVTPVLLGLLTLWTLVRAFYYDKNWVSQFVGDMLFSRRSLDGFWHLFGGMEVYSIVY
jgi:hypothetical protein